MRWVRKPAGSIKESDTPQVTSLVNAKTFRRRLLTIPGRLTRSARRWTLHLPARWPWQQVFEDTLGRLRALPAPM